ncbi:MAG TPA: hypothetical protein VG103_02725, partial [Chthoniobacterales bacterium]|nr:hypothetical protein [Chthoniobacterales bacterium]
FHLSEHLPQRQRNSGGAAPKVIGADGTIAIVVARGVWQARQSHNEDVDLAIADLVGSSFVTFGVGRN